MAISGRNARRSPEAMALADSGPAGRAPASASASDQKRAVRLIRLGLLRHMLRSSRFYERVALGVIVLSALRGLGRENSASAIERLAAWNKREMERLARLEHKVRGDEE